MKPLTIISCDSHIGPLVETYREYLDPEYHHLMPQLQEEEDNFLAMQKTINVNENIDRLAVIDENNRVRSGGLKGAMDVERRLQEMDADGIAAEVVYPGPAESMTPFFYQFNKPYPNDVRMAGARAYHRWLAEAIATSKGRLIGTMEPGPSEDMDEVVAELRFCAERGFRAVYVPGSVHNPNLPPLTDKHYEPYWAACSDLGMVTTIHAGWGMKQGDFPALVDKINSAKSRLEEQGGESGGIEEVFGEIMMMVDDQNPESIFSLTLGPRQGIWQAIFAGVFDRHPNLKMALAECRADWVPAVKKHLDDRFRTAKKRPNIKRLPSEYFGENVFFVPTSPRRLEAENRHQIGVNATLFGTDYPHMEGTWPNTLAWLQKTYYDVTESELRAILGENAIKVYGLDRSWAEGIAAKIGPKPSDILGNHAVSDSLLADWDFRSGYNKTTPLFEDSIVNNKVDGDIAATA